MVTLVTIIVLATTAVLAALGGLVWTNFLSIRTYYRTHGKYDPEHPANQPGRVSPLTPNEIRTRVMQFCALGYAGLLAIIVSVIFASGLSSPGWWVLTLLALGAALVGGVIGRRIGSAYANIMLGRS
jgi:hypothetical protein